MRVMKKRNFSPRQQEQRRNLVTMTLNANFLLGLLMSAPNLVQLRRDATTTCFSADGREEEEEAQLKEIG